MTLVIVATAGATNANSFVTEAEMDAYAESRINGAVWTDSDTRLQALVEATRDLTVLPYVGSTVTSTQALAWPREWAPNPDAPSPTLLGNVTLLYYANTVVPQRVKDATCELALQYLVAGGAEIDTAQTAGEPVVVEKTVDVLTTKWDAAASAAAAASKVGLGQYTRVINLLRPLLDQSATGLTLSRV